MNQPMMVEDEATLLALLPRAGPIAASGEPRAVLKRAAGPLVVEASILTFTAGEEVLEVRPDAFGLTREYRLEPPCSRALTEPRGAVPGATRAEWRLNGWRVCSALAAPEAAWSGLIVHWLPLMVPAADDRHLVADVVNTGGAEINILTGIRSAILWVDGTAYPSAAGWTWNGRPMVAPGHTRSVRFSLTDFPSAPLQGEHEMALEMLGRRSPPETVDWRGAPWVRPEPGG